MANPGTNTDNSNTAMKNRDERSHTTDKPAADRGNRAVKSYGKKDQFEPMKIRPEDEEEKDEEDEGMTPEDTGAKSWKSTQPSEKLGVGTFGNRPYGKKDDPHAGEHGRSDRQGRGERPERNPERGERPSGFGTGRGDLNAKPSKEKEIGRKESRPETSQETTYADDDEEDA